MPPFRSLNISNYMKPHIMLVTLFPYKIYYGRRRTYLVDCVCIKKKSKVTTSVCFLKEITKKYSRLKKDKSMEVFFLVLLEADNTWEAIPLHEHKKLQLYTSTTRMPSAEKYIVSNHENSSKQKSVDLVTHQIQKPKTPIWRLLKN